MTRSDRRTLSEALAAQAQLFEGIGAEKLARGLRRRASRFAASIQDVLDVSPAPALQPIPVRQRETARRR